MSSVCASDSRWQRISITCDQCTQTHYHKKKSKRTIVFKDMEVNSVTTDVRVLCDISPFILRLHFVLVHVFPIVLFLFLSNLLPVGFYFCMILEDVCIHWTHEQCHKNNRAWRWDKWLFHTISTSARLKKSQITQLSIKKHTMIRTTSALSSYKLRWVDLKRHLTCCLSNTLSRYVRPRMQLFLTTRAWI